MTSPFFGERWDAPVTEHAQQVPTPIGTPCGWCAMPIADGDQGKLIGSFDGPVPFHRECLLTSVVGSPAHLDGRCTCHGGQPGETLTPQQTRAESLEVWERVQSGRLYRA